MTGIKPKYLPNVMEAIVQLLQVYIYFHVNPLCDDKIFLTHFLLANSQSSEIIVLRYFHYQHTCKKYNLYLDSESRDST
jgi:hypothetical protein